MPTNIGVLLRGRIGVIALWIVVVVFYLATTPALNLHLPAIPNDWRPRPIFWAVMSVLLFLSLASVSKNEWDVRGALIGGDGQMSTSKFQFFLWTAVIIFAFVWVAGERTAHGHGVISLPDLPKSALIAMGLSIATAATAKGITVSYVNSGRVNKGDKVIDGTDPRLRALVLKDDMITPDLTKIQMLVWTIIAAVVYLSRVFGNIHFYATCAPTANGVNCFPDIDAVFMVLMGLGQGAYLGGKLVSADTPSVTSISLRTALPGQEITVEGALFGSAQNRSILGFGSAQFTLAPKSWSDSKVVFDVPLLTSTSTRWQGGETIDVVLMIDGSRAEGNSAIAIALPDIGVVFADRSGANPRVVIRGGPFGGAAATSDVSIGGVRFSSTDSRVKWSDNQIEVVNPGVTGTSNKVVVTVGGYSGRPGLVAL
jgi:hypothetical protein